MLSIIPYQLIKNSYNPTILFKKTLYDPSIGQSSLTKIDVVGVLASHIFFGVAAALLVDWSWIPLNPLQRRSGRSLKDIKRSWGWDEKAYSQEAYLGLENKESLVENNNE